MKKILALCAILLCVFGASFLRAKGLAHSEFHMAPQRTNSTSDDRKFAIAFSPDGSSLALGGIKLDIWSSKGYLIQDVQPPKGKEYIYSYGLLLFSGSGEEIISASRSGKVVNVHDAATGEVLCTMTAGTDGNISSLALSRDGATLAIGTDEGDVEFWDYAANKFLKRVRVTNSSIVQLAFLAGGKKLVYGAAEIYTVVRTARSLSKTMNMSGDVGFEVGLMDMGGHRGKNFKWRNKYTAEGFSFAPAPEIVAVHDKSTVWLLNSDMDVIKSTAVSNYGKPVEVYRAQISPDGKELAVMSPPGFNASMTILSLPELAVTASYGIRAPWETALAYTPDSRFICLGSLAESSVLMDPHTGTLSLRLFKRMDLQVTADISPDGRYVASGGTSVALWPIDGGDPRPVRSEFTSSKVILAPDGRHIVVSRSKGIEVTELDSGEGWVAPAWQISPVAVSPDGGKIAYMPPWSGSASSIRLAVADSVSGKVLDEIPVNYCPVEKVQFSGSGRFLAWGRGVYDLNAKKLLTPLLSNMVDISADLVAVAGYTGGVNIMGFDRKEVAFLRTSGRVTAMRFSPDGKLLAAGLADGRIELWGGPGFKRVKRMAGHDLQVMDLEFSHDGRFLVSSSNDGATRVWNLHNFNSYTRVSENGEWLIYTPDGYFDASPRGEALAAMVSGVNVFGLEQFALRNNRPDIILRRMGLGSPEQIAHYKGLYLKRLKKLGLTEEELNGELHAPEARIISTDRAGKFQKVNFLLYDTQFRLKSYNVYVNNVPLFGAGGRQLSGERFIGSENIELAPGKNKIEVSVTNSAGVESFRTQVYADNAEKVKGDLYYIAFGVSDYKDPELGLNYADKDAKDLEVALLAMRPQYGNVFSKVLLNSDATAENIKNAKAFLSAAKTGDTVVLFAAGHGGYSPGADPKYYYLPYEADRSRLEATGIGFEVIEDILDGIKPRKKLFLLDTCDSGELDEATFENYYAAAKVRGIQPRSYRKPAKKRGGGGSAARPYLYEKNRMIYNDLSRRTGAIVFSSSRGGEISYESPQIQNGYFTHEVVSALSDRRADQNGDGRVSTAELRKYVSEAVSAQTKGLQHPSVDRDNIYQEIDFPVPGGR